VARTFRRWSPDTCGCSFYFQFDDELEADVVVFSYISDADAQRLSDSIRNSHGWPLKGQDPEAVCPAHEGLGGTSTLWTTCQDENVLKNQARGIAESIVEGLLEDGGRRSAIRL